MIYHVRSLKYFQVMKMYMPLVASEDGIVQLVKQPGVSLEPGDILGVLTLDDPARVKHAKPFEGQLPVTGPPGVTGSKPYQRFTQAITILNDILDGFDNQSIMAATLNELIETLHDPTLPYSEIGAILASLSGRIPSKLEDTIRAAMDSARSKGDSTEFPAQRLKKVIDAYVLESILPPDRAMFRSKIVALTDALEKYISGLRGFETETLAGLLGRYEETEKLFGGSIETRVLALREQNKEDLDKVASLVLSHIKVQSKAKLVFAILDYIKQSGLTVSNPDGGLYKVLKGLAALEAKYVALCSLRNCHLTSLLDLQRRLPSRPARSSSSARCLRTKSAIARWRRFSSTLSPTLFTGRNKATPSGSLFDRVTCISDAC